MECLLCTADHKARLRNLGGNVVDVNLPSGNAPRTVSLWMKYSGGNGNAEPSIFQYGNYDSNDGFGIYFSNTTGRIHFRKGISGAEILSTQQFNLTQWKHIVVVHDGTKTSLYVDGVLNGASNNPLNTVANSLFILGGYKGLMDDLRIYNKALTLSEIELLYNNPETGEICNNTAVRQVYANSKVDVYPNPTSDIIHFEGLKNAKQYAIIDVAGRIMEQGKMDADNPSLNISHLREGYYLVRFDNQQIVNFIKH